MAKSIWAGLDVGVETISICVIDDAGEVLHQAACSSTLKSVHKELSWLRRRRRARVALEAGVGTGIARGLRSLGYSVDIYETRQLSKFLRVRRNKTDAGDANGIAEAGRIGAAAVSKVYLKTLEGQSLQSRLTIRRQLIRERVAAVNLLCRQFELFGGRITGCTKCAPLRQKAEAEIRKLFGRTPSAIASDLQYLIERCAQLMAYQDEVDQALKRFALGNELCRRLMQIPGVGPICALSFYATIGDPDRFPRSTDVGSYLGLTPRLHQSGTTSRSGRISRMGNRALRGLLVQAGVVFMRCSPETRLRSWTSAVERRRGRGRARVALARKLAIIMLTMWKKGESYQPVCMTPAAEGC